MFKILIASLLVVSTSAFAAEKTEKKADATKREPNQVQADFTCRSVNNQSEAGEITSSCSGGVVATTTEPRLLACCPVARSGGGGGGGGGR